MKRIDNLISSLLALRSAVDEALGELDTVKRTAVESPRSRRNRKEERVGRHALNYASGKIRKPKNRITIKNAASGN